MKTLLWDVTNRCNLACKHCYNAGRYEEQLPITEKSSVKAIFECLKENGFEHVHLLGGEPLCSPQFEEILVWAKNMQIAVTINTNGILLTEQIVDLLHQYKVMQVTISLDGATAEDNDLVRGHGSFDQAILGLETLCRSNESALRKITISVASVINQANAKNIHKLATRLSHTGVDNWMLLAMYIEGNAAKNYDSLAVSPEAYYEALRKVAFTSCVHQLHTYFDVKPLAYKQLCNEFGFDSSLIETDSCRAGKELCFMDCQGNIFPCGPSSYSNIGLGGIPLFNENQDKAIANLTRNLHSFGQSQQDCAPVCENCKYKTSCTKCPIKDNSFDANVCKYATGF